METKKICVEIADILKEKDMTKDNTFDTSPV